MKPRRWLVTGAFGMLGHDVVSVLRARRPYDRVQGLGREDLDITDVGAVRAAVQTADVVINCAAWTDVDGAEDHEPAAFDVNALGPALLAQACAAAEHSPWLVHISTDYVFSGDADRPYREDSPVRPLSAYGRTKAAGEWAVRAHLPQRSWILRTAWLYGWRGDNFVSTVLRLSSEKGSVGVVTDQRGQPTWTIDVANRVVDMSERDAPPGTFHATAAGETTRLELARLAATVAGDDPGKMTPTDNPHHPARAPRPKYSVLGHDGWELAGLRPMRRWDAALREALDQRH